MGKSLVIVESPAKARTIKKYLGPDYEVMASYGHVRDLRPKEGAVVPAEGFLMHYEAIERSQKHIDAIMRAAKKADALFLATDPDREGEAISWHLVELLREKNVIGDKPVKRVVFHEITQRAIQEAVSNARELSMDLVNAQQARRALDYLVGFNLSPLLWKKIRRGLSAGRVQSPALRLIAERETEIEAFESREYWTIEADLAHDDAAFDAKLSRLRGEKIAQFTITSEKQATEARRHIEQCAKGSLRVVSVEKKQRRRNPVAPFTTSTLQQDAVRKLGFTAQRTMRVAQQLYEGVDTGSGLVGLISYMRTDSVTLANDAVAEIRQFVTDTFGADRLPDAPRLFKTTAKNAQEAHEAVRPTSVLRTPDSLKEHLSRDQQRLYELIWKRTVACQMKHALIDTVAVDLACEAETLFRATGSTIADAGFLAVYEEGLDEGKGDEKDKSKEKRLPPLAEGDVVTLKAVRPEQHFTEPPPRYSEATLVKTLEEYGIGRPSTYAAIIQTLLQREYAVMEGRRFHPTDIGRLVNRFLTEHFGTYVDYAFTARLEDDLDAISRGEKEWIPVMGQFWGPFSEQVQEKDTNVSRGDVVQARELGSDPVSGRPVAARMGRYGPFVQIGTKEDEEKPRFAGLRQGQSLTNITLAEALALFKLPRDLGQTPEGEPILVNVGRFGPYVKYGAKFASLGKEDDPYTVDLQRALDLIAAKEQAMAEREIKVFAESDIKVLKGRFGPYITDGKRNARLPKDREPASIELDEAKELLEKAPPPRKRRSAARRG